MAIQDPWELVSLTIYLNGRFEKEFEGVQDVFELQVRPDTSTRRMTTALKDVLTCRSIATTIFAIALLLRH